VRKFVLVAAVVGVVAALAGALVVAPRAGASRATPYLWQNCTHVHTKYRHGVGRANARDRVRGSTAPVTTFKRSTTVYRTAIRWNSDLDRDRDGVACEKR
jgi:hypothetical protein